MSQVLVVRVSPLLGSIMGSPAAIQSRIAISTTFALESERVELVLLSTTSSRTCSRRDFGNSRRTALLKPWMLLSSSSCLRSSVLTSEELFSSVFKHLSAIVFLFSCGVAEINDSADRSISATPSSRKGEEIKAPKNI